MQINPKDSFYHYVNQDWLNTSKIPKGYSRWSRFNELSDKTLEQLKNLLLNVNDTRLNILINLFENYNLNNETVFINNLVDEINSKNNISQLLEIYQKSLLLMGVNYLYSVDVGNDMKNSTYNILYFGPSGLTLPGRDYYLEEQFEDKRQKYLIFIKNLLDFHKIKLDSSPEDIFDYEKYLAGLHLKPEEKRNPDNVYFPKDLGQVIEYNVPLNYYFQSIGKKPVNLDTDKIICSNEKYFEEYLNYPKISFELLRDYLIYKTILKFSMASQGELYNLIFDFFGKTLSGKEEPLPQWKRTINLIDGTLGELLGKEYVKKHFSQESKNQLSEMIEYFKDILQQMIKNNTWMESSTKEKALDKLKRINYKIGYPSKWEEFTNLAFSNLNSLSEVLAKINEWWFYHEGEELYQNTDLEKWEMYPHQVNAYYHPLLNEIVFPAAILQPPFYSKDFSEAQNFGGIGVVIAHEITHGFDDQGKRFDANGNLNNWWTEKDEERFQIEANKLVEQFNNLELYETKLNGKLTLGENLADLGGVRISLAALKEKHGKLTGEMKKEFFESFAKIWANLSTQEEGQKLIKIDPHSPGIYRVNGILPHLDEFHETYQITENDKMHLIKENRCQIWCL